MYVGPAMNCLPYLRIGKGIFSGEQQWEKCFLRKTVKFRNRSRKIDSTEGGMGKR